MLQGNFIYFLMIYIIHKISMRFLKRSNWERPWITSSALSLIMISMFPLLEWITRCAFVHRVIHWNIENIEIMINDKADEVIEDLSQLPHFKNQMGL